MTDKPLRIAAKKPVAVRKAALPAPLVAGLRPGDTIEVGVTAEMKIDGDSTWVSYKVQTKVGEDETSDGAHERATSFMKDRFKQTVYETVDMIQAMS